MVEKFVCCYPTWLNNSGHEISYIKTLKKFALKYQCKLFIVAPKKNEIKKAKEVVKILNHVALSNFQQIFKKIIPNFYYLKKFYKEKKINSKDIFLLESASFEFLISFLLSNIFSDLKFNIYIYCRYDYEYKKKFIFKLILYILKRFSNNVTLLTDTIVLKKFIYKTYNIKTILMPVPHTFFNVKKRKNKNCLFFPGPFRPEKYGANFQNFLENHNNKKYTFIIHENFKSKDEYLFQKLSFNNHLSIKKYSEIMNSSSYVILPYDSKSYLLRTSGIFIEAISLKKKIFVTNNTWMSNELRKFKLEELIVRNWKKFNLELAMKKIDKSELNRKINFMSQSYSKFHSEKNYIKKLGLVCGKK
ncbi:hypothetical protein HIMB114_00008860 [alpha proteobacterium HIMB114]|nr:hypothetical protein HIMB114_00008860 [alpha proteobacterium HIMB114]